MLPERLPAEGTSSRTVQGERRCTGLPVERVETSCTGTEPVRHVRVSRSAPVSSTMRPSQRDGSSDALAPIAANEVGSEGEAHPLGTRRSLERPGFGRRDLLGVPDPERVEELRLRAPKGVFDREHTLDDRWPRKPKHRHPNAVRSAPPRRFPPYRAFLIATSAEDPRNPRIGSLCQSVPGARRQYGRKLELSATPSRVV